MVDTEVNEAIMAELLHQPEVKKSVLRMTAKELEFFKTLLVKQGIYARFVRERAKTAENSAELPKK
jgi:hypothetical protein